MNVVLFVQEVLKMDDKGLISKALSTSQSASIKGIVNRTLIVEWGTIKKVVAKGVVEVLLAVTDKPENTAVVTCTLLSPCAKSIAIDIEPQVGDKVLVLSPRRFDVDMFTLSDNTEVIERANFTGYNNLSCVAILYNQYRPASYERRIEVNKDCEVTVTVPKATINIDKNGNVKVQAKGKFTIKNDTVDLKDVIDGLAKELENLTTAGSATAQATSPASKATIATWRTSKLNSLLD